MGEADGEGVELREITIPLDDGTSDLEPLIDQKDSKDASQDASTEAGNAAPTSVKVLLVAMLAAAVVAVAIFVGIWMATSDTDRQPPRGPGSGAPGSGGDRPAPNSPWGPPPSRSVSPPEEWKPSQTPPPLPLYPAPALPSRASVIRLDDIEFGAVGDGVTMNTEAFEKAVRKANTMSGGTTLVVPAGKWLTGPFFLTSHLTLQLNAGATILASQVFDHYASITPFPSYFDPDDLTHLQYRSFISGADLVDVAITGKGTIDGQGKPWWDARGANASFWSAPRLVEFVSSTDIIITDVTLKDSQLWTLHPIYCTRVHIHGITIIAPNNSRNTDGINPDSSEDVLIENCRIDSGDDSIAIKSGRDNFGLQVNRPSRNITIRSLTLGPGTHGISIGSELSGGISDINIRDIVFLGGANGLRIKTTSGRGGYVKNVRYENIWLRDVRKAVIFTSSYSSKRDWHPGNNYDPSKLTSTENITVSKLAAFDCTSGVVIEGFPSLPFEANLNDILIVNAETPWLCENVKGKLSNVQPAPPPSCPLST